MSSFLTTVNWLLICSMQETKKCLATFKKSLISNHLYLFPARNVRKSYSVHLVEPHLLRLRCMENSKGLLNLIFDSRGLDPESKIVHLHILQCRLCNFQPHFKCIERDICDFTKAFFKENSLYHVFLKHRFWTTKKIKLYRTTSLCLQCKLYMPE